MFKTYYFINKICILYLIQLLLSNHSFAQIQPNFVQYLTDKGLQSSTIYNLHIAKNGLLYIAHSKGLSSFDGNNFTNYYNKDRPFTEITNLMETDNGDIFCKAFNNVLFRKIDDSLRKFTTIIPYSFGFTSSSVYKNDVYSITNDSIIIFNAVENKKTAIALNNTQPLIDKQPVKFIGTANLNGVSTVFIVNNKKKIYHFSKGPGRYHYSQGDLFFIKNKSIMEIDYYNQTEQIKIASPAKNISINYVSVTDSVIWVCTTNGLFYRNKFNKSGSFNYIFSGYDVSDVKQTKEGNFFISTIGQGLLFVPNFNVNKLNNIPNNITSITGYANKLLLGTKESTVLDYDVATSNYVTQQKMENGTAVKFLLKNDVTAATFISSNYTLISGKKYPFIIKDYCVVKNSVVLATSLGIYLYEKEKTDHWLHKYISSSDANDDQVKKLSFSNEHTSTIKYNPKNDRFYINNYSGILEMADGYKDARKLPEPNCVLKDMCVWDGELLLASKDKDILRWTGKSYEAAFTKNKTTGILYKFEPYKNELWVLGEEAVFCYKNNKLIIYNNQIGISSENIMGLYISEKTVYASNGNAVIQFSKNNPVGNIVAPRFILNKVINVNANKIIKENSSLPYNENFISFQFSLVAYANALNTHIAYSINNKDIVHLPSDRREINLDILKPESYTIEFYTVSNNITSSKPISKFSFYISPPFYNTLWFYTCLFTVISCLAYLLFRWRIKLIRSEMALKEAKIILEKELDKSTLSSIKAQMNPHFIFNALNTIQSYVYMNDKRNASIYISKFSNLTRSILNMSNKESITLSEEIKSLELYLSLEKMRFEDTFEYVILVSETVEKERITLPSMLLQPYVENAVKHGLLHKKNNRILSISFSKEDAFLKIVIDDNGIGRKRSEELNKINYSKHASFAMNANKKRIDILQQQYKNINLQIIDKYSDFNEAMGTQVIIQLPIQQYLNTNT